MAIDSPTLFALDIGTRSVVGLLLRENGDQHELIDIEVIEHQERSMLDGQIHNIPSVAAVIAEVKERLEKRHHPLHRACVAAAGRSLLTKRASYAISLDEHVLETREDLLNLELSAVSQAQYQLSLESEDQMTSRYDCVGYSVLEYRLDGSSIGSLLQQNGKQAEIEVIATFLPKVVVESLLSALHKVDLQLEALTLEPIAAIDVLIPTSMRRLNVALVDIGAGTSDIALTAEGTVQAYGMVPIAGDEITEALSDYYLLDFPEAEKIKRLSLETQKISVTDILGHTKDYTSEELFDPIKPAIQSIAMSIADEILRLNGKPPKAVMLVGGGSQTPFLTEMLADSLNLPKERVAVRGIEAIQNFSALNEELIGPELVTPVGIAIAAKQNPIHYVSVNVNGRVLRLFDAKKLTIGDAFVSAGIDVVKQYGKPGMAIVVEVNDKLITIPGFHGKAPQITKNGVPALITDSISEGDHLIIKPGQNGTEPEATIGDIIDQSSTITCYINGNPVEIATVITRNQERVDRNQKLQDRDTIKVQALSSVKDLLQNANIDPRWFTSISVDVNHKTTSVTKQHTSLLVNGRSATLEQTLAQGDRVDVHHPSTGETHFLAADIYEALGSLQQSLDVTFNEKPLSLTRSSIELYRGSEKLSASATIHPHDVLTTQTAKLEPFIIQDLFAIADITIPVGSKQTFKLTINQSPAEFISPLSQGDRVELTFVSI
ncbi:cell division protein FtsA [Alkalicoccobacillus porphyridii]|uniref:Cell division protein FtsA n=1 Tax=Alkalicoccobacillus porphyridii TaxID=2597270 RepID=A0A554A312_9BACI|nr:cell division protein FtsA [Alkalicoccobacillus porphyridii]TSB48089.1 cell division protein FtsA [Alkalicoccobacillus porphyridii]